MTELTPQEKLLKLQQMGKMPKDDFFEAYIKLAQDKADLISKINAFEKWLALGTPFMSAQFDHAKVLEEYRKFFGVLIQSSKDQEPTK